MKFVELHPEWGVITPSTEGIFFLSFDCVHCGPPYRIYVRFHRDAPREGIWQSTSAWRIVPNLEHLGEQPELSTLTLTPSIGFHTHGPKRPTCGWHFNIVNGETCQ